MKRIYRIFAILSVLLTGAVFTGCVNEQLFEITDMDLDRCLEPMNLKAKVYNGDEVAFSWDVSKDALAYNLEVYADEGMTDKVLSETVAPDKLAPSGYRIKLTADKTYWFRVQATSLSKSPSKWAVYDGKIETYAEKGNLFLKVAERGSNSLTFSWTADPEVTHFEYSPTGSDNVTKVELTEAQISAASATIEGLEPSTDYLVSLYYMTANRGEVDVWTLPDLNGLTRVTSLDAFTKAIADGASILLSMEGSPYEIASLDISKGMKIYGEGGADGSKPVIKGEFHITDTFDGGDLYFQDVEFNGAKSTYGFAIQHKNGCAADGVPVNSIKYKNCVITGYSKGLFYEWGKTLKIGEFSYEDCDINNINPDGSVGGDGFDVRQATEIGKLRFVNNTIYNGFRTFLRIDANPVIGDVVVENNTLMNLCFVDNTNNGGLFAFQTVPGSFSLKNNLFLYMVDKALTTNTNVKYKTAGDLSVSASNNWYYGCADTFFSTSFDASAAAAKALSEDPCYNAKGGFFNILKTSDIAGQGVGASKWWIEFVEEPEDLTLPALTGAHTWDFSNAKFFSGDVTRSKVRDNLFMSVADNTMSFADGHLHFNAATAVSKKGIPTDGFIAFKVAAPGSLVIKPCGDIAPENHLIIAAGPADGSAITVKGGAAAIAESAAPQKILISDITEESLIYIYSSGPIGIAKLAWSEDLTQVNTALGTPAPAADPSAFTAGEATDVVVSWEPVPSAASYSAVFNGKTFNVEEGMTSYTIEAKTTSMLDAGSYTIEIFANPGEDDIYNTQSSAGVAAFAVLPKAEQGGDDELVVKTSDELLAAISAGKSDITLAAGEFDLGGALEVIAPLSLKGQKGAVVKGAFNLTGDVQNFQMRGITFNAAGQGCFITLLEAGVTATAIVIDDCVLDGYSKSAIYGNYDSANIDNVIFNNIILQNHGTGQGIFDFRKGTYGNIAITESTIIGGRDFIRADAACNIGVVTVRNNTFDGVTIGNGNGVLYVRAEVPNYLVANNLFLNETGSTLLSKTSGVKVPSTRSNFFYNVNEEKFFSGLITKEIATDNGGALLTADPVKDAANHDYTLTSGLAISSHVGARRWNPAYEEKCDDCFIVKSADEFFAALDAGKTDLKFAAEGSPYDLTASAITVVKDMRLSGEIVGGVLPVVKVSQFNIEGEVGTVVFDGIEFVGNNSDNLINVSAITADKVIVRNCDINSVKKSIYYGNGDGTVGALVISNVRAWGLGGGQGTFDIRKGSYGSVTIESSTIIGGRDFIRADKDLVTGAISIVGNTFDSVTLDNGNGILWVRSTPETYIVRNNLFLNENGANNLLAKSGATKAEFKSNFYYNCVAGKFWTGTYTKEDGLTNGGVELSYDPCKDAANGDYTLIDALCLSSNIGAARWNPNAGRVTTDITVSSLEELLNSIDAGKTAITLKYGSYDFSANADLGGILTISKPLTLKGEKKAGAGPEIIGSFKFDTGMTEFIAEGIRFNGKDKSLGNTFEVAGALETSKIMVRDCEIFGYNKSLIYGNAEGSIGTATFSRLLVHDMGTGQGMFDLRKKIYGSLIIENSTIYNGGRDFVRCDAGVGESISIKNNTLASTGIDAGNGLLWIRSDVGDKYVVENNLFLNETGSTKLAKSGAVTPVFKNNWFFNVGGDFWSGAFDQATATANGGGMLTSDPCTNSAEFNFKLVDANMKTAGVGDPRWK